MDERRDRASNLLGAERAEAQRPRSRPGSAGACGGRLARAGPRGELRSVRIPRLPGRRHRVHSAHRPSATASAGRRRGRPGSRARCSSPRPRVSLAWVLRPTRCRSAPRHQRHLHFGAIRTGTARWPICRRRAGSRVWRRSAQFPAASMPVTPTEGTDSQYQRDRHNQRVLDHGFPFASPTAYPLGDEIRRASLWLRIDRGASFFRAASLFNLIAVGHESLDRRAVEARYSQIRLIVCDRYEELHHHDPGPHQILAGRVSALCAPLVGVQDFIEGSGENLSRLHPTPPHRG